jgi:hypothetical protein
MSDRWLWPFILLGSLLSFAVSCEIATLSLRLGSLEWGWTYSYAARFTMRPIGAALLVAGSSTALLLLGDRYGKRQRNEWLLVAAWIVLGTVLHAMMRSLTPADLESIFRSDAANSFYSVTQKYGARQVLRNFNDARADWPLHAQSNMPGKLMFLYALQLFSANPQILPWIIVGISNLGAALIYAFSRILFDDRRTALWSAVLYLFVPARIFFFPLMNTVTPLLTLGCAWLLLRMLAAKRPRDAALLGVAVYGVAFFEPLPLVLGLLFAALMARAWWLGQISARELLALVGVGGVAFATTYAAMYLWFGFDLLDAFRRISAHAVEFNVQNARPYAVWITQNLRELALGMGVCQAVVFFGAAGDGLRGPGSWRTRLTRPISVLCLALLLVVAVIDLIGVNRGEVIRLWIFLACLLQIPTAYVCARIGSPGAMILVLACSAIEAALGTAMIAFVIAS